MTRPAAPSRRALTLVELLLAISVTAIMGLATASMLSMTSTVAQADRDGRSVLLRAHAAQARLRAYLDPALCVLQHDTTRKAMVIWLQDVNGPDVVNLTEMRVFWFDSTKQTIDVERVEFPQSWPQEAKDLADVVVPIASDFITVMETQRGLGYTVRQTLVDKVWSVSWSFTPSSPLTDALRVRASIMLAIDPTKARDLLFSFGQANHRAPLQ